MERRRETMWRRFQKRHPLLYEAVEWAVLVLAAGAFLLAVAERMC